MKNNFMKEKPIDLINHTLPSKTIKKFELKIFTVQEIDDQENENNIIETSNLEKRNKIFQKYLSTILKNKKQEKFFLKKILKFFTNVIIPNLIASILLIILMFSLKDKTFFYENECTSKNSLSDIIFKSLIQIITQGLLYFLMGYYVFLKPIISKKNKNYHFLVFLYFMIMVIVHILFSLTIYYENILENKLNLKDANFIIYFFDMIIGFAYGSIITIIIKIKFVEYRYNLFMTFIIMGLLLGHSTKSFLFIIIQNKLSIFSGGWLLFRLFVFIYMQLFENLLFFLIKKLIQNEVDTKNTALIFIKYFLCEVICSSMTSIIKKDMILGESVFSIMTFIYQILVFYRKKNFTVFYIYRFYMYFCQKDVIIQENETQKSARYLAAGVLNDALVSIYLKLIIQFFSDKFISPLGSSLKKKQSDCFLNVNKNYQIKLENILSALLINFLVLIMSIVNDMLKKKKISLWKTISYPFFLKFYYDFLFFYVTDINIQFYSGFDIEVKD